MDLNELQHHGIKGMRWGIRRYQNKDGSLTPRGKKRYAAELEKLKAEEKVIRRRELTKAKLLKLENKRKELDERKKALDNDDKTEDTPPAPKKEAKKKIKDMSTEELQVMKDRLQLEKDYKDLLNQTRGESLNKGRTFAENVLSRSGEQLTTQVLNHFGAKLLNKMIGDEVIFANNKKK